MKLLQDARTKLERYSPIAGWDDEEETAQCSAVTTQENELGRHEPFLRFAGRSLDNARQ